MQKTKHKEIQKGDVWLIDNTNAVGYIQKGIRPHVVVTQVTDETVTVAPCTSVLKKVRQKYVVEILPTRHNGLVTVFLSSFINPLPPTRVFCRRKSVISMIMKLPVSNSSM